MAQHGDGGTGAMGGRTCPDRLGSRHGGNIIAATGEESTLGTMQGDAECRVA